MNSLYGTAGVDYCGGGKKPEQEINQAIGSVEQFGFLLEEGFNVLDANIVLGGILNDVNEIIENATYCEGDTTQFRAEKPWYRVTSAYEKDGLIMVNASLIEV